MAKKRTRSDEPRREPDIAEREEAAEFFRSLQSQFRERLVTPTDRKRLRQYLATFPKDKIQRVMRRAVVDLVQHKGPVLPRRRKIEE
jgi:hypothetical protein